MGDLRHDGDLIVTGNITGYGSIAADVNRSSLIIETVKAYPLPPESWRVWDGYDQKLPCDGNVQEADLAVSYNWSPTIADDTFFVAIRSLRVVGIIARVEVIGTGGACTAVIKKVTSGTDIASGTALHSGSINLVGTVDTNQTLTLATTIATLDLVTGDAIGIDLTGTPTSARGCVTILLARGSADDLSLSTGTTPFGAGLPYLRTSNSAAVSVTQYARTQFTLPPEYVGAQTAQLRFAARMMTTIADTSATVDVEVYRSARSTLVTGSDLCTTSATSCNSLTVAEKVFDLTATSLVPGSVLDIRCALAVVDAATVTAVYAAIAHAEVLLSIRG